MSTPRALAALVLACAAAVASAFAPDALAPAVAALRGEGEGAARALQGTFGQLTVCEQDIPVAQQYPCDMLGTGTITVATVSLSFEVSSAQITIMTSNIPVAIICPVSVTSLGKDPAALALSLGRWSVVVNISSALPSLGLPTTMCGLVTSSLVNSVSSRIVWTLRGHLTDGNPPLQCPSLTNPTDGDLASSQDFAPKSCTASGARPGAAPRDAVAAAALAAVAAVALAAGAAGARGA